MLGEIAKHRSTIIQIALAISGIVLVAVAQIVAVTKWKVNVGQLIAEVGALLLVVAVLHWLFEIRLREEMLRDVAAKVTGSTLLHDAGLEYCLLNSRDVDDSAHWSRCSH